MDKERVKEIKNFISKIKEKFNPDVVILFGSRARGDFLKTSDYDLIIVSDKFEGIPFIRRMELVYELLDEPVDVDLICYTPEEFKIKKKQIGIVKKAVEEGVIV